MSDKLRDEIRTVHEAYQFLSRKYAIDKERLKEKEMEMQQLQNGEIIVIENEDDAQNLGGVGLGTAMALKSAANVFKGQIEGNVNGKETNNKTTKRITRIKLDSNEEKNDNTSTNPGDVIDPAQSPPAQITSLNLT